MARINWPATLPTTSLLAGYGEALPDGRTISEVPTGVGRRRRGWQGLRPIHITMNLSRDQWARLRKFWEEDTQGGILPFAMPRDNTGSAMLSNAYATQNLKSKGMRLSTQAPMFVQFTKGGTPKIDEAFRTGHFKISFDIEVLP